MFTRLIQQSTEEDPDEGVKDLVETALKKLVSAVQLYHHLFMPIQLSCSRLL